VIADLALKSGIDIPRDLRAEVHSQSAIGEQYVELLPRNATAPPLRNGDVIALKDTSVPQDINSVLDAVKTGLQAIPRDLYEAARVDGANAWQRFRVITWPLLLPAFTVALIFRKRIQAYAATRSGGRPADPACTARLTVLTGAVLGVLVSISSVGAGALGVTALFFLYPAMPALRIVGSDIAHAVPLTAVAGIGHWFLGSVDWLLLGSLIWGAFMNGAMFDTLLVLCVLLAMTGLLVYCRLGV